MDDASLANQGMIPTHLKPGTLVRTKENWGIVRDELAIVLPYDKRLMGYSHASLSREWSFIWIFTRGVSIWMPNEWIIVLSVPEDE